MGDKLIRNWQKILFILLFAVTWTVFPFCGEVQAGLTPDSIRFWGEIQSSNPGISGPLPDMGRAHGGLPDDIFGINRGNVDVYPHVIDKETVRGKGNSMFEQRLALNSGFGTNPAPGTNTDWIPRPDGKVSDKGFRLVFPDLGAFILLGCGLLTLAGWGRRKYRR
jgi:hypothetical protein